MKMKNTPVVMLAVIVLLAPAVCEAADDGDFQVWLKAAASGKFDNGIGVKIEEELRYSEDAGMLFDEESFLLVTIPATDWLKVGLGYRAVQERKEATVVTPETAEDGTVVYENVGDGDHYWQHEQRPIGQLVFKTKAGDWGVEDRVRAEWRMKDDGKADYPRFRNRLKVKSPWKLTDLNVNPYLAWEAFYENKEGLASSEKLNRHRYYAGIGARLTDHLKGGIYYMMQNDLKKGEWKDTNVAGLEIGVSF